MRLLGFHIFWKSDLSHRKWQLEILSTLLIISNEYGLFVAPKQTMPIYLIDRFEALLSKPSWYYCQNSSKVPQQKKNNKCAEHHWKRESDGSWAKMAYARRNQVSSLLSHIEPNHPKHTVCTWMHENNNRHISQCAIIIEFYAMQWILFIEFPNRKYDMSSPVQNKRCECGRWVERRGSIYRWFNHNAMRWT